MVIRRVLTEIKLIQMTTIFVLAVYFVCSDRQEQGNTFQYFGILLNQSLEILFDVLGANKRIENIQFNLNAIDITMDFLEINVVAILRNAVTET